MLLGDLLDAIRYLQKEVYLILTVFGLHPEVARVWQRWVGAMLGDVPVGGDDHDGGARHEDLLCGCSPLHRPSFPA